MLVVLSCSAGRLAVLVVLQCSAGRSGSAGSAAVLVGFRLVVLVGCLSAGRLQCW